MNTPACKALLAVVLALLATGCGPKVPERVRLVTTTSTDDSGLSTFLLEPFQEETGIQVQVVAVGSGQALELGRRGDADLVLVHARKNEDEFVAQGWGIERRDIMWNDFLVAGPKSDPAAVRGLASPAEAFGKIKASGATFVSRGDESGTHVREKAIWAEAGGPPTGPGYIDAGQGMGPCLLLANQRQAYILADRGTWLAYASRVGLDVLVEGDPALRNPYGIILVNPEKHPDVNASGARKLRDWLVSPAGQARIGAFQIGGQVLFHPAATGT